MKKLLSIALCICLTLAAVFTAVPSFAKANADPNTDAVVGLLKAYNNNGNYEKETNIFPERETTVKWHANASQTTRTTVYSENGTRLYMSGDNINGGYKDVGENMERFHIVGSEDVRDYTVANTSVKEFFTDLEELAGLAAKKSWDLVDGKYETAIEVTETADWEWVHFIAPMWTGSTGNIVKLAISNSNGLYLQLYTEEDLFAQAIITPLVNTSTVVVSDIAVENEWTNATKYTTLSNGVITATTNEGQYNGAYYSSSGDWRLYQADNATLTISAISCDILGIAIDYSISNTGVLTLNGEEVDKGAYVPVENNTITFGVGNTGDASNGQVRVTTITVYYTGGCAHNIVDESVAATCGEEGLAKKVCSLCGWVKSTVVVPATGEHDYVDGICTGCGKEEPSASEPTYQKATSIAIGDTITLVYEASKMEISAISTTSTKYGLGVEYTTLPEGVMPFKVVEGASTGTVAFKNGDNYLYWTSGNSLNVNATLSAKTSWTVTFDANGNAVIKNASDSTRIIYWNTGSPRFACYTSAQAAIQIYKLTGGSICSHANTTTTTVDATCTEAGSTTITCEDCGETISTEEIPATDEHNYVDGECTVCGKEEPAGEEVTTTLTFSAATQTKVGSYTGSFTATIGENQWTISSFNNNNNAWNYIKAGSKNAATTATIVNTTAFAAKINTVTFNVTSCNTKQITSAKLYVADNNGFNNATEYTITVANGLNTVVINAPIANGYYKLEFVCAQTSSNGTAVQISQVEYIGILG